MKPDTPTKGYHKKKKMEKSLGLSRQMCFENKNNSLLYYLFLATCEYLDYAGTFKILII